MPYEFKPAYAMSCSFMGNKDNCKESKSLRVLNRFLNLIDVILKMISGH